MALNSGIQTHQILTDDDEVCITRLSSTLLAVNKQETKTCSDCKNIRENSDLKLLVENIETKSIYFEKTTNT